MKKRDNNSIKEQTYCLAIEDSSIKAEESHYKCVICGGEDNLVEYKGKMICRGCIALLSNS